MTRLQPYGDITKRQHKVVKHVFGTKERWWDVLDGLIAWRGDWDTLRVAGCFNVPVEEVYAVVVEHPGAEAVLRARHEDWLAAASTAAAQAQAAGGGRVRPQHDGRRLLIGDQGVVAVVAGGYRLVTCWREPDGAMAAVRRADRRASLVQPPQAR
ncbi:hypothetical protein L6R49_31115 [Myxococcota bacterium]|nr:hypothetical protein [Myxococcota bacterium]